MLLKKWFEGSIKEYKYDSLGRLCEEWSYELIKDGWGVIDLHSRAHKNKKIRYNSLGDIEEVTIFRISFKEKMIHPDSFFDIDSSYFTTEEYTPYKYIYEYF